MYSIKLTAFILKQSSKVPYIVKTKLLTINLQCSSDLNNAFLRSHLLFKRNMNLTKFN